MDNDEENLEESDDDEEDESEKQYLRNLSDDGKPTRIFFFSIKPFFFTFTLNYEKYPGNRFIF